MFKRNCVSKQIKVLYIIRESSFPHLYHTERLAVKMINVSTKSIAQKTVARSRKNGEKCRPDSQQIEISIELTHGHASKQGAFDTHNSISQ